MAEQQYLYDAWYVAALSTEINQAPVAVTILEQEIVLYRCKDNTPVALVDACPHRKLPLSMGSLEDDNIICGYHGLTFDRNGQCVAAPTQNRIPPTARVRSFPVTDRYGLVWIWMGNENKANPDTIIAIDHVDDPTWHMTQGDSMQVHCHYLYLTDNLLDPSHVAWVHKDAFASSGTEDTPLEVSEIDDGVIAHRWVTDTDVPGYYQPLLKFKGKCDRLQHYEVQFPSVAINKSIYTPAGKGGANLNIDGETYIMISYNFLTPIDADRTRYFWLQQRNTDPEDESITKRIAAGARQAFSEDKHILEAVHRGMKKSDARPMNLGLDAASTSFRNRLNKRVEREG